MVLNRTTEVAPRDRDLIFKSSVRCKVFHDKWLMIIADIYM